MANVDTVQTAAQTNTQIDADDLNPTVTQVSGRHVVHVTLVFQDVTFDPNALYDALDAQYGTVATNKGTLSRDTYIFVISA